MIISVSVYFILKKEREREKMNKYLHGVLMRKENRGLRGNVIFYEKVNGMWVRVNLMFNTLILIITPSTIRSFVCVCG